MSNTIDDMNNLINMAFTDEEKEEIMNIVMKNIENMLVQNVYVVLRHNHMMYKIPTESGDYYVHKFPKEFIAVFGDPEAAVKCAIETGDVNCFVIEADL